jgi:hypothetical protein
VSPLFTSGEALSIALLLGGVVSARGVGALLPPAVIGCVPVLGLVSGLAALRDAGRSHSVVDIALAAILVGANGLVLRWAVQVLRIAFVFTG